MFITLSSFGSIHVIPSGMTVNFYLVKVKNQGFDILVNSYAVVVLNSFSYLTVVILLVYTTV